MMHQNHIFKHRPIDPTLYVADIAAIAIPAIHRHGEQEWHYATLACQLHGHVGIYSLLGVKMGLYARKQLNADLASMHIISHAGSTPPMSCLNDGLQVATGSTLGHGLIEVSHDSSPHTEAEFSLQGKHLHLCLKPSYDDIIQSEVAIAQARYGESAEYWHQIRQLAIKYWLEWDRDKIFEQVQ